MEADLARFYHLDLGDYWRRDDRGRRRLTLRRIGVLVAHLPADAALVRVADPHPPWSIGDVLAAHIWQAVANSKNPHPMLAAEYRRTATARKPAPARTKAVAQARRRAQERLRAIQAGDIA